MACQGSTDDNAIKIRVGRVTFAKWDFCNLCLCAASCYPHMMNKQLLVLALVLVTAACTPTSTAVPTLFSQTSQLFPRQRRQAHSGCKSYPRRMREWSTLSQWR